MRTAAIGIEPIVSPNQAAAAWRVRSGAQTRRLEALVLCSLTGTAFALRLFLLPYQYVINTDGVYYAHLGRQLITGHVREGLSAYWPPLYPLLLGVASLVFNAELAGRVVSVLAGTAVIVPAYFLIRDFYGRTAASLGALFLAVFPSMAIASTVVMTESTYGLMFVVAILAGWRALRDARPAMCFAAGLAWGACYLIKPEASAYAGLFAAILVFRLCTRSPVRRRLTLVSAGAFVSGVLLLALPYVVYVHSATGRWTVSLKLVNHIPSIGPPVNVFKLTPDGKSTVVDWLYGAPSVTPQDVSAPSVIQPPPGSLRSAITNAVVRASHQLKPEVKGELLQVFPYPFMFLAVVGLFRRSWTRSRLKRELYLTFFIVATLIGYAATAVEARYLLVLVPLLMCWAANGFLEFESWLVSTVRELTAAPAARRHFRFALSGLLLLSMAPSYAAHVSRDPWRDLPLEHKRAGLWIRDQNRPHPLIMAAGPWAPHYADGGLVHTPDEDYATVLEYARRRHVDYLVIGKRCLTNMRCPADTTLGFLVDGEPPPELDLVFTDEERPQFKVRVYQFRDKAIP
jgi:4-amino-4-deoxy-L-arabinose transferase-like glycosyltransferase